MEGAAKGEKNINESGGRRNAAWHHGEMKIIRRNNDNQ
jgi:hypothetical protein